VRQCVRNGSYGITDAGSLRLDVGKLDHLGPFVGFFSDYPSEVGGRSRDHGPRSASRALVLGSAKPALSMLQVKPDLVEAARHAGMPAHELRREMGKAHVRRYSLEQRQLALEAFCLGSSAALAKVRDESENGMAIVASVKAGEQLRIGAVEAEASAQKRAPGLSIVILQPATGERHVAYQPPPLLDIVPVPEAVPATRPDAEAE
jgi:hypothetical protein